MSLTGKTAQVIVMKPRYATRVLASSSRPITQDRLRRAIELFELEAQIVSERRALLMEIDIEIAAGADVEPGDLAYYKEVKAVGRSRPAPGSALRQMR